jgi:hypothetical protein
MEYKKSTITENNISIISLHRHSIYILDTEYKNFLLDIYKTRYNDLSIVNDILKL